MATVDDLISAIRDCGAASDRLLQALLERGPADPSAPVVIVAALLRLCLARCRGDDRRVDDLAGELGVVLGEAWRGTLPTSERRLANVMVDRAWGRVRASRRKGDWLHTVGLDAVPDDELAVSSPEDLIVTQLAVSEFGDQVRRRAVGPGRRANVAQAWGTAVSLVDRVDRSREERNQWVYARTVLRRHVTPDLELLVSKGCERV
jgi:hypothetical protein